MFTLDITQHLTPSDILRKFIRVTTVMASHRILITGASGYLGGTLLARWKDADLPASEKLFALVRTDAQAQAVQQYGAEPLEFDAKDEAAVLEAVVSNKITIVYYLIDAVRSEAQVNFIKALAEVKKETGQEVHFLHVSSTVPCAVFDRTRLTRLNR